MRTAGLGVVALLLLGQGFACGSSGDETGQTSEGGLHVACAAP